MSPIRGVLHHLVYGGCIGVRRSKINVFKKEPAGLGVHVPYFLGLVYAAL